MWSAVRTVLFRCASCKEFIIYKNVLPLSNNFSRGKAHWKRQADPRVPQTPAGLGKDYAQPKLSENVQSDAYIIQENPSEFSDTRLNVRAPEHQDRFRFLSTWFPAADIETLATVCPIVFYLDEEDVKTIVFYVHTKMGLDQSDVIKAAIFKYPVRTLIKRHIFLERCGAYHKVTPKNIVQVRSVNPSLRTIVAAPDEEIARIANVSLEEFRIFSNIFELQKRPNEEYIDVNVLWIPDNRDPTDKEKTFEKTDCYDDEDDHEVKKKKSRGDGKKKANKKTYGDFFDF